MIALYLLVIAGLWALGALILAALDFHRDGMARLAAARHDIPTQRTSR